MNKKYNYYDLKEVILENIKARGGWVNTHCHLDRAFTLSKDNFHLTNAQLQEKWYLNDELKKNSTVEMIYDRMAYATERQIDQGVQMIGTFIDVDDLTEDKAIKAAMRLRETFCGSVEYKFINQTLKGVIQPTARKWFDLGAEFCDILGGLPKKDAGHEDEHLDILMETAKKYNKMVHVHVDQLNLEEEKESEQLVRKTIEHSMQGRVVAVHGISIGAQKKEYREKLYHAMAENDVMLVSCPTAWIDSRRTELLTVTHNSIAPIDELVPSGVVVAIGPDNIADIYKPFCDGDMWTELKFLLESCHFYDINALVDIATINGLKALGIQSEQCTVRSEQNEEVIFERVLS